MRKKLIVVIAGITAIAFLSGCAANPGTVPASQERISRNPYQADNSETGKRKVPELSADSGLADYLAYAALHNPGLEAAFNRWKAALEQVPQVSALPDPRFTYQYFITEVETRIGPQRESFGLSQTFPWFGKLKLRGDAAMQEANIQQQRYEAAKLKLFFTVKDAYYEYYYLAQAIAITRENMDLLKYLEGVVRTRFKVASSSQSDLIRIQVELGKLEDRLSSLQDLRGPVAARLNAALNRPVDTEIPWPAAFSPSKVSLTDKQLSSWLKDNNPELKAIDFEIARQNRNIRLARKAYYPDITVGLNYIDTAGSIGGRRPSDDGKDPLIAMVSLNIPIWRDKYAAGVRQAKVRQHAALQDRLEKENTLGRDLQLSFYKFRDAARKIDLYKNALLPKAKESLKVTEASFISGKGNFIDLIDAQRILLEFQLAYERAKADHEQQLAELELLTGKNFSQSENGNSPSRK